MHSSTPNVALELDIKEPFCAPIPSCGYVEQTTASVVRQVLYDEVEADEKSMLSERQRYCLDELIELISQSVWCNTESFLGFSVEVGRPYMWVTVQGLKNQKRLSISINEEGKMAIYQSRGSVVNVRNSEFRAAAVIEAVAWVQYLPTVSV